MAFVCSSHSPHSVLASHPPALCLSSFSEPRSGAHCLEAEVGSQQSVQAPAVTCRMLSSPGFSRDEQTAVNAIILNPKGHLKRSTVLFAYVHLPPGL